MIGGIPVKRLAILLLTLLLLAGCNPKPTVVDLGGRPAVYPTVELMEADADLIVTGKVRSCESRIEHLPEGQVTSALTVSQFKIYSVDKGNVRPGDLITIWQDSAFDAETNTIYQFAEVAPLIEYEEYTLYLKRREPGSEYYIPVSAQGIRPTPGA